MKRFYVISILVFLVIAANAQKKWTKADFTAIRPVCYASDSVHDVFIPPPAELKAGTKESQNADIRVIYSLFPQQAKQAFDYAVSIWESIIQSPVPIYIQANWRSLDRGVLGSCGPSDYLTDFEGIPRENRYYPISVVEKITKTQITGMSQPDMYAEFNRNVNWYFGTDGNVPDSLYDFVTVVLHEIGHGLGFTGFFYVNVDLGTYVYYELGDAAAFDLMVVRNTGDYLVDTLAYKNSSEELKKALTSNQLFMASPVATLNSAGLVPRLYAPVSWNSGSSIYHLDDATYPTGSLNSLMTHAIGRGEAVHDPGPITEGIMADIGWKHMNINFIAPKDQEEVQPITFQVYIESDYALDTSSLYVIYSLDGFQTHSDSVSLVPGNKPHLFTATLVPESNTDEIHYFLSATDVMTRTFRKPTEAPQIVYTVDFGPDDEPPLIVHNPIEYYFSTGDPLHISALVADNIGVDTVFVEYSVNGNQQESFGLVRDSANQFTGTFGLNPVNFNDGDIVSYTIVAVDSSSARNVSELPPEGGIEFRIEKMLEPLAGYMNDFDDYTADFILFDFNLDQPFGFDNGALHSPHPYPSPERDDSVYNFTTLLKHPIILQEGGTMSFDEVVLVEPGSPEATFGDESFWDYVIVEGSPDNGDNWFPLADGYDSGINDVWEFNYTNNVVDQVSSAIGTSEWYVTRQIDLLQNEPFSVGDTILVRFRLFSDPYAHGWGWVIDNLRIQNPTSAPLPLLSPGHIAVYPNPFTDQLRVAFDSRPGLEQVVLEIFNSYGQKIRSFEMSDVSGSYQADINLGNESQGMYLLSVSENGKRVLTKKLVKQ